MELLDTIPIYVTPLWLKIFVIILCIGLMGAAAICKFKFAPIIALISLICFFVGLIVDATGVFDIYDHDEYVVRLNDISVTEFIKDYNVIKTYEYSDAIRIKKKDGVK